MKTYFKNEKDKTYYVDKALLEIRKYFQIAESKSNRVLNGNKQAYRSCAFTLVSNAFPSR